MITMKFRNILLTLVIFSGFSISAQTYWGLQKKLDAGFYEMPSGGIFNFKFTEEYPVQGSGNLDYKIYKEDYTTGCASPPTLTEVKGDNRFQLNLSTCSLSTGNIYIIEVFNQKKERWVARFKYN